MAKKKLKTMSEVDENIEKTDDLLENSFVPDDSDFLVDLDDLEKESDESDESDEEVSPVKIEEEIIELYEKLDEKLSILESMQRSKEKRGSYRLALFMRRQAGNQLRLFKRALK